ncbi:uncharacterized protein LOC113329246 isoform X2 [Papaver somniferum]|uniref:uncharacterized protein LOC113329246 isoform X2 n=1 Tax=Papaver somniferum TaxID=3469 RepID=UPI000E70434B|nr:uncharacterized protein LOC113329246 isoform X2 [Papaver somniferum]
MASFCRSAARSGMRSMAASRNQNLNSKPFSSPFPLPTTSSLPRTSRFAVALASVESMMPLHSAIANSRLKSSIAVDSSCWSWMSQDFAVPR